MRKKSTYAPNFLIDEDFDQKAQRKTCDKIGCQEPGEYRAPKSRNTNEYLWFCLDHVRDYNAQWDYYKGMETSEIESHRKADMTWQRPSWPLGEGSSQSFIHANRKIHDPFSVFKEHLQDTPSTKGNNPFHPDSDEAKALILMDLEMPLDPTSLKERYKSLAKQYHPDHNRKDPLAEERLKAINHAYAVLKKYLAQGV